MKQPVPGSVYLATRKPNERMIRMLTELDGKMPEIKTTITRVMRLKDQGSGKEYLVYNKHLEFNDKNGNLRTLDYTNCNSHEEAEGIVRRNIHHEITESEVKGVRIVFDELWNKNKFEQLGTNEVTELNWIHKDERQEFFCIQYRQELFN